MVSVVNSHTNATRIGWHLWGIDFRFCPGLPPGWDSLVSPVLNPKTLPFPPLPPKCMRQLWRMTRKEKARARSSAPPDTTSALRSRPSMLGRSRPDRRSARLSPSVWAHKPSAARARRRSGGRFRASSALRDRRRRGVRLYTSADGDGDGPPQRTLFSLWRFPWRNQYLPTGS